MTQVSKSVFACLRPGAPNRHMDSGNAEGLLYGYSQPKIRGSAQWQMEGKTGIEPATTCCASGMLSKATLAHIAAARAAVCINRYDGQTESGLSAPWGSWSPARHRNPP